MVWLGIAITAVNVGVLVAEFWRHRRAPLSVYGWLGLAALVVAEVLVIRGIPAVATYFTPIAWTTYILLADSAVLAITGHSPPHDEPRQCLGGALLSTPLRVLFDA